MLKRSLFIKMTLDYLEYNLGPRMIDKPTAMTCTRSTTSPPFVFFFEHGSHNMCISRIYLLLYMKGTLVPN